MHRSRLFLWSHADQRPFSTLGESKLLLNCPKVVFLALFSRFFDVQCALLFLALIERKCSIKTHIFIYFFFFLRSVTGRCSCVKVPGGGVTL